MALKGEGCGLGTIDNLPAVFHTHPVSDGHGNTVYPEGPGMLVVEKATPSGAVVEQSKGGLPREIIFDDHCHSLDDARERLGLPVIPWYNRGG